MKACGKKHRDWIYMWYSRNGGNKEAREFARNQRYKLYGDGNFYDIESDVLEKSPLGKLSEEQGTVRSMLRAGIDQFEDKRPAHLGLAKAKKNKDKKAKKKAKVKE